MLEWSVYFLQAIEKFNKDYPNTIITSDLLIQLIKSADELESQANSYINNIDVDH